MTVPFYERPELASVVADLEEEFSSEASYHHTSHHVLPPNIDYDRLGFEASKLKALLQRTGLPESHQALELGDTQAMSSFTDEQAQDLDEFGNTLLHRAVMYPDRVIAMKMITTLLHQRAPSYALNEDGKTPLDLVRDRMDFEQDRRGLPWATMMGVLIQQNTPLTVDAGSLIEVPFVHDPDDAPYGGEEEQLVATCVEVGLHDTVRTIVRDAPWYLEFVTWANAFTPASVDVLIELGFSPSDASDALSEALTFKKPVDLIEHLVGVGAGFTPMALHQAMKHPAADRLVPMVLNAGLDPAHLDSDERNALLCAVVEGRPSMVNVLLDRDVSHALLDQVLTHPHWLALQTEKTVSASVKQGVDLVNAASRRAMEQSLHTTPGDRGQPPAEVARVRARL